jgi:hypothetical protein
VLPALAVVHIVILNCKLGAGQSQKVGESSSR